MKVIILRGLSGSGKSTYAAKIAKIYPDSKIVSADNFFIDTHGVYNFYPEGLGDAHTFCLNEFIDALNCCELTTIIVDNTNSQAWEIAPYVALAKCWNCAIEIHRTEVDPVKAFERNVHHVPKKVIESMAQRFEKNLPNFWPKEHIVRTDEVETLPFHS